MRLTSGDLRKGFAGLLDAKGSRRGAEIERILGVRAVKGKSKRRIRRSILIVANLAADKIMRTRVTRRVERACNLRFAFSLRFRAAATRLMHNTRILSRRRDKAIDYMHIWEAKFTVRDSR